MKQLKKSAAIAGLALAVLFGVTACGGNAGDSPAAGSGQSRQEADVQGDRGAADGAGNAGGQGAVDGAGNAAAGAAGADRAGASTAQDWNDGAVHITTADDLAAFAEQVNAGETALTAVLENDIDMSGICGASAGNFEPIQEFEGEFDGNGHVIENLYCVREGSAMLFSSLSGTVKNLRLENAVMESEEGSAAGIAGSLHGRIENCSVSGSITAYKYAGGIAVDLYRDSSVVDCVSEAQVSGGYFDEDKRGLRGAAAGIAAWPREGGTITGCINRGSVSGNGNMAAGIAGHCENGRILIENCVNEGEIRGRSGVAQLGNWGQNENYVGGIAGYAGENTAIAACVNKGNVFGTGLVGGIAGASGNFIINCANHGDLEAAEGGKVYGIASLAVNGLLNCYNTGDITGDRLACGIGSSSKTVTINLYNYGTITCTAGDGVLTDAFPWSSGGAATGLLNTYSRENCIVAPDGGSGSVSVQAGNAVPEEQFTDGTILAALNTAAADINSGADMGFGGLEDYVRTVMEYEYFDASLSQWKAGADGLPCFEWE